MISSGTTPLSDGDLATVLLAGELSQTLKLKLKPALSYIVFITRSARTRVLFAVYGKLTTWCIEASATLLEGIRLTVRRRNAFNEKRGRNEFEIRQPPVLLSKGRLWSWMPMSLWFLTQRFRATLSPAAILQQTTPVKIRTISGTTAQSLTLKENRRSIHKLFSFSHLRRRLARISVGRCFPRGVQKRMYRPHVQCICDSNATSSTKAAARLPSNGVRCRQQSSPHKSGLSPLLASGPDFPFVWRYGQRIIRFICITPELNWHRLVHNS